MPLTLSLLTSSGQQLDLQLAPQAAQRTAVGEGFDLTATLKQAEAQVGQEEEAWGSLEVQGLNLNRATRTHLH